MASDIERLDALLRDQEEKVRLAFLRYVADVNSPAVFEMIIDRLELGDIDGAKKILESHIRRFGDVIPSIHQEVGNATAAELTAALGDLALAVSFDVSNPGAAAAIRTHRLALITNFSDSQFEAVEDALRTQFETGAGAQATARRIREVLGLGPDQAAYVASYRRSLETRPQVALDRALRDRRFDNTVMDAVAAERPLTAAQVNMMVDRYRARAIAARAETIARTEAGRAFAEARRESLEQMLRQTNIGRDRIARRWNRIDDPRVRDWHDKMQGQQRGMDEPFVDGKGNRLMYPHDPSAPAETVINCRCTESFTVRPPA